MSELYVLREKAGDILDCERCNSAAPTTMVVVGQDAASGKDLLKRTCKFCHETEFGRILRHPDLYPSEVPLARALCQALNLIYWKQP